MRIVGSWAFDRADVLVGVGLIVLAAGAGLAWAPAGVMVCGLGLMAWGVLSDLARPKQKE